MYPIDKKMIIGILAGMGPRSTAPFLEKVIEQCQKQYGAQHDIDYPHILIYSLPTPFFVDKPIDHKEMKKIVLQGIKKLEEAGVSFIAIPCNTVHIYFNELQKSTKVPLLNIVKETIKEFPLDINKVTLFATQTTIDSGLFQKELERKGIRYILKNEWQQHINKLIFFIKKGNNKEALKEIKQLVKKIDKEKVDTVIVACTDLQSIIGQIKSKVVVDSTSSLAKAVVKKYLNF